MTGCCPRCGKIQHVPSGRGSKLADARCRNCGSPLLSSTLAAKLLGVPSALDVYHLDEAERATRFGMLDAALLPSGARS